MDTNNNDADKLASALKIALVPIQNEQEKLLKLQILCTRVGEEGVRRLHEDYASLSKKVAAAERSVHLNRNNIHRISSDMLTDERIKTENLRVAQRHQRLEDAKSKLDEFEEKNPLYIEIIQISGLYGASSGLGRGCQVRK